MYYLIVKEDDTAIVLTHEDIKRFLRKNKERIRLYRVIYRAAPQELRVNKTYVSDFFGNLVFDFV